jgi:formate dehydrogenase major subunit
MTNHWADIDNSSLVFVIGANPTENHPACMAHVNAARYGSKKARLIVVDPRKTRTAQQADLYVRIRPGTDIAFINGVLNYIMTGVAEGTLDDTFTTNLIAWHDDGTGKNPDTGVAQAANATVQRAFLDDTGGENTAKDLTAAQYSADGGTTWYASPFVGGKQWPKYCDSRARVVGGADGYKRVRLKTVAGVTYSNMPEFVASIFESDTVYTKLKAHVANYTTAEVADICGCAEADIVAVANELIANSRMKSVDFGLSPCTPTSAKYKATTILYAMGQTQHTNGSQNIRDLAVLQTMLGNMGRPGGGINALRGIHNVQGSTDMALLYDGIPGYSGNPSGTYPAYSDGLFGNRVVGVIGTGPKDPYNATLLGLQQRGFYNMTTQWFGQPAATRTAADFDTLYDLWPKGNGVDHITAFRQMAAGTIKAALVWGQNPAVTEPNQSAVRAGLEALDTLVCVDVFENETAACKRKSNGVTYLLPACSYVEEAGSVTNSGRWIQWRDRARAPHGNSKADLELLLRLAKALATVDAFTHITAKWGTLTPKITTNDKGWDVLYGKHCGTWEGITAGGFEALSMSETNGRVGAQYATVSGSEVVAESVFKEIARRLDDPDALTYGGGGTVWIYSGTGANGSGYDARVDASGNIMPPITVSDTAIPWTTVNRAKSRNSAYAGEALNYPRYGWAWLLNRRVFYNNSEVPHDVADTFVAPGLLSRMMTFTTANTNVLAGYSLAYRKYNALKDLPSVTDGPHTAGMPGNFPAHTEPIETPRRDLAATYGRNLSDAVTTVKSDTNVALWSSADPDYADDASYGSWGASKHATTWDKDANNFPFVLTTIRCVEHFQGGVITRNNTWNVEAEPVPWIEINSVDARAKGIKDGDWVNVVTARSNSTGDQEGRTVAKNWAKGFIARVGVGLQANQRVAAGVVAIPWHWGEQGLATGSRANDLCIDASDANTAIPEYKACLCNIEKIV